MAACLSPVNLSAPMSSFFLRPAERQFQPFQQELVAAISTAMRQPRGPPAPKTPVLGAPAPILMASEAPSVFVAPAPAPKKSWRDRVAAAAEVKENEWKEVPAKKSPKSPKSFKTPKSPKSPKSPKKKTTKAARTASPEPIVEIAAAPVQPESPSARVYDITYLLCLSTSPLVGVTEAERTHMEDLVYNHTWRRGPHQSISRPSSRASSRSSSPTPSSRSSSPAPAAPIQRLRSEHRRTSSKLRNSASSDEE
ncbi:unnamed protein product [Peniophora sp. CBMAI 1063]|nr:unnamed protein product [Peniophora sp. CBMAI 1063]